jgi:hypothetical protein
MAAARETVNRLLLALCCTVALESTASAASPLAAPGSPVRRQPQVAVLGPSSVTERQDLEAVTQRLRELPIRVVVYREVAQPLQQTIRKARSLVRQEAMDAVVWLGYWHAQRTLFVHTSAGRTLARQLARRESSAADREELAIVARTTVGALLDGGERSMEEVLDVGSDAVGPEGDVPPAEATPSKSSQRPPEGALAAPATEVGAEPRSDASAEHDDSRETEDGVGLSARAGYVGSTPLVSAESAWQSGGGVALRLRRRSLYLDVSYAFLEASTLRLDSASASFQRHPATLALGAVWRPARSPSLSFAAELSAGADGLTRETVTTATSSVPTSAESRWLFSAGVRVAARAQVARRVGVYALLGADALLSSFDYVAVGSDASERESLRRFVGKLDVGASFDFWGAADAQPSP